MNHIRKIRVLLATCVEMAQECGARIAPRSHFRIRTDGRVDGLKEAIMMIDGYVGLNPAAKEDPDKLKKLLGLAVETIEGLADQQAMPDGWYEPNLEKIKKVL